MFKSRKLVEIYEFNCMCYNYIEKRMILSVCRIYCLIFFKGILFEDI